MGGEIRKCLQEFKEEQQKIKIMKSKKKQTPVQSWTGPEGSRRSRLPDFKTIGTYRW